MAFLGAIRTDKPNGEGTARVLVDGTHGVVVETRTRIRDQEVWPKLHVHEPRAKRPSRTSSPVALRLAFARMSGETRSGCLHQHGRHVRCRIRFYLLVASCIVFGRITQYFPGPERVHGLWLLVTTTLRQVVFATASRSCSFSYASRWAPDILEQDVRWRLSRVGRVRAPPSIPTRGDIGTSR